MLELAIGGVVAAALAYYIATFAMDFKKATGSLWQRALAAAEDSATLLWAKVGSFIGGTGISVYALADYFNDSSITDPIKSLMKPEYVLPFTLAVAIVTRWARKRTLAKA